MAARKGIFTSEELLGWLHGSTKPALRANLALIPPPGRVAHEMSLRVRAAEEEAERQERGEVLGGPNQQEEEEEEEEEEEDTEYKPNYNFTPDDASVFDNVENYDPGNLPNPNAQPGDHDYGVDQSVDIYNEFSFDNDKNPRLPIHRFKQEIVDTIASGQVRDNRSNFILM